MALALLALADLTPNRNWVEAADVTTSKRRTREIISWLNEHYGEKLSLGSYDDIRRQDLLWMSLMEYAVTVGSRDGASQNDPSRRFGLAPDIAAIVRQYGTLGWEDAVRDFRANTPTLEERLTRPRQLRHVEISLPGGQTLQFGPGEHNVLIKAVVEEFLPRFGYGAEVLYVGDASDRDLLKDENALHTVGMFELQANELPDVVAYSRQRGWLYIIEAVHSSGPVSREKHLKYQQQLRETAATLVVYVTAFASREKFGKFAAKIAWETEVWLASEPDHLIHYNGDAFLDAYERIQQPSSQRGNLGK